ncbi:MAG: MerR family transcriptional regulator [Clostridia bacterium]|nr:MerR family transcriptional regulator [Clostridia bacterium]
MLNIRQLSQLLGISPQTIRTYEQHGIFEAERSSANYRKFGRSAITTLMKCRKLMGMGFSIRQILQIASGTTYPQGQLMLREQADALEKEIRLLMDKRRGVVHMHNIMKQIREKQGACVLGTAPAVYCCPVLKNTELLIGKDAAFLDKWNEYAFLRHDVKRIPAAVLMEGTDIHEYTGEYCVRVDDAERLGLDVSHAYRLEEHLCVTAYAVCPADNQPPIGKLFSFAADYIREHRLKIVMDLIIFLPFWPLPSSCDDHLLMAIYVEPPADEQAPPT